MPAHIYEAYTETTDTETGITKKELTEMTSEKKSNIVDGTTIYRYSPSKREGQSEAESLYFYDKAAMDAYAKDHPQDYAEITEYKSERLGSTILGFGCYYNLWWRHYNDESADPQLTYPMEYATVRNNIYRVAVSFSGPGDPSPTMREPDTMQARIFVRKWNYRTEDKPLYFD